MQGFVHFIAENYTTLSRNRDQGFNQPPGAAKNVKRTGGG